MFWLPCSDLCFFIPLKETTGFGDDDIMIWKQSYPKQHRKLKFDKVQCLLFVSGLRIIWVFDSNRMFVSKVVFIIHTGVQECFKGVLGHLQYMLNAVIDGQNCLDWSKHWCVLCSLERWKKHIYDVLYIGDDVLPRDIGIIINNYHGEQPVK